MLTLDQVRVIQVELTTRCNARCPMCMRNYRGYEYNSGYPVREMSFGEFTHIISPAVIQRLTKSTADQLQINFNGNLGDFAMAKDAVQIVEYLVQHSAKVSINTNGSLRTTDWWKQLALPGVSIGFAIDGLADTHSLYRQDTDWNKVIANARSFISAGGRAVWRFIPFDHNRHQELECRRIAKELGFADFEVIYDGRDRTPVYNRTGEFSHYIGQPFDNLPPPPVRHLLESHITWFNKDTVKNIKDTDPLKLRCTHLMNGEIYIAADGAVYPCCYLGFYPKTMQHPGNSQLKDFVQENNALEYDLEHCLRWFRRVEESWSKKSVADGRLYHCVSNCGQV